MKVEKNRFEWSGLGGKLLEKIKLSGSGIINSEEVSGAKDEAFPEKEIICPYCLKTINLNEVLFRASDSSVLKSEKGEGALQLKKENDEKLVNLIEQKKWGIDTTVIKEFDWGYGEDDKGCSEEKGKLLKDAVKNCILNDSMIQKKEYTNGIPTAAVDKNCQRTETRICPECHCILPKNYGTRKTYFFAVVGVKGSGKTIFLSQFFKEASSRLLNAGITVSDNSSMGLFVKNKKISLK